MINYLKKRVWQSLLFLLVATIVIFIMQQMLLVLPGPLSGLNMDSKARFSAEDIALYNDAFQFYDSAYSPVVVTTPTIFEPVPTPAAMFFAESTINPFIETAADHQSTFAVDVDTGAYTIMRRYVTDGNLPPADSVRVEEYINYFDQQYPPPARAAFNILLDGAHTPYDENESTYLIRIGIQGYEPPAAERPDLLLIFAIDVSDSMGTGNRLGLVKESLTLLVESLRPTDQVGIISYGSMAQNVLLPTQIVERHTVLAAINSLHLQGSTNAEAGLRMAYDMVQEHSSPEMNTRIILASDGVANVGRTTADAILEHAQEGISLSTFGFGMGNYNDQLMEQLANQGDGSYAYIDTLAEARRLFVDDLNATLMTIAKDAKIQVTFNQDTVFRYRLLGYENRAIADEDFRNDSVDAGEIGAGHSVTALYEIELTATAAADSELLTVSVRYADPDTGWVTENSRSLYYSALANSFQEASPYFQLTATVAEYAEILRHSPYAEGSDLYELALEATRIAALIPLNEEVQAWARLTARAAELEKMGRGRARMNTDF